MSDIAYTKLKTEMFMRHKLGDISKSMQDIIILNMISDIDNLDGSNNTFPIFLDASESES
jgi:hypothetical protein